MLHELSQREEDRCPLRPRGQHADHLVGMDQATPAELGHLLRVWGLSTDWLLIQGIDRLAQDHTSLDDDLHRALIQLLVRAKPAAQDDLLQPEVLGV